MIQRLQRLQCPDCGNADRFVEVMRYESHLVDGGLNYLHLLAAEADHYTCFQCGREVAVEELDASA
jgi:DNA-directed RNA polymerase subunit RPC12/RpoP